MFVVVAAGQRKAPPPAPDDRRTVAPRSRRAPVGVRHAITADLNYSYAHRALCGADVKGWVIFPTLPFAADHPASCRRCGQLTDTGGWPPRKPPW